MGNTTRKNILIIANKTWEAAPLVGVLLEKRVIPGSLVPTGVGYHPELWWGGASRPKDPRPRLTLACATPPTSGPRRDADGVVTRDPDDGGPVLDVAPELGRARIQVWCIEDWMDRASSPSSTFAKAQLLAGFFAESERLFGAPPDAVVAFGTAGIETNIASNGCVAMGTRAFVHDPFAGRPAADRVTDRTDGKKDPMWSDPGGRMNTVLTSSLTTFFRGVPELPRHAAEARMLRAPLGAAKPPVVLAGNGFASVSTVNVTNYDDYVWADPQTRQEFRRHVAQREVGSMETTHGVIRLAAEDALHGTPPYLYVSGITDSLGLFDMEVTPRNYAQNFVAAHNAGVALAWLLPELVAALPAPIASKSAAPGGTAAP